MVKSELVQAKLEKVGSWEVGQRLEINDDKIAKKFPFELK